MVVGYYGCLGVNVVLYNCCVGFVDNWLYYVQDVCECYVVLFDEWLVGEVCYCCLIELNLIEQVVNVCCMMIVNDVWVCGQLLIVYGFVYGVYDGWMCNFGMFVLNFDVFDVIYKCCVVVLIVCGQYVLDNDMVVVDVVWFDGVVQVVVVMLKLCDDVQ